MNGYLDLSEKQHENLFFFLEKVSGNHFAIVKEQFDLKLGQSLKNQRDRLIHALIMEELPFSYFEKWLSQLNLHGNNTLFLFEPEKVSTFTRSPLEKLFKKASEKKVNIFDINTDNLSGIKVVHVAKDLVKEQIIITLAAPAYLSLKDEENTPYLEKDIYLAYLTIDYKLKHMCLSIHPTHNLHSVYNYSREKGFDTIALMFMDYFKKNFLSFNYSNPEWILEGMATIVDEYFDHNNPIIKKKLSEFRKKEVPNLIKDLIKNEPEFNKDSFKKRFERALVNSYESELIEVYKQVPRSHPFSIFFHEAGKGIVSFMANSNGKPLNFADSRMTVKMMMENTMVASLGITFSSNGKSFPYKISKAYNFISLKRVNNSGTPKEIVDDVLSGLNKYKPVGEFEDQSGQITEAE